MDDLAAGFRSASVPAMLLSGTHGVTARLVSLADTLAAHPAGTFPEKLPAAELKALN